MTVDNRKIAVPVKVKVWIRDQVVMEANLETALDVVVETTLYGGNPVAQIEVQPADAIMRGLTSSVPDFLRALADEIEDKAAPIVCRNCGGSGPDDDCPVCYGTGFEHRGRAESDKLSQLIDCGVVAGEPPFEIGKFDFDRLDDGT